MDFLSLYRKKLFPALSAALWLTFLFLDLTGTADSTPVKFAAIILCAATAWTGARSADGKLVAAALTLTVCADVFLLLLDRNMTDQIIGVTVFIGVQLLYAHRLCRLRGNRVCKWGLALRLAALALALLLLALTAWAFQAGLTAFAHPPEGTLFHLPAFLLFLLSALTAAVSPVVLPTLIYFSNLCINCAEAFALKANRPVSLFPWALLLFIACDICVGASNLGLATSFTWWGSWLFYLPSQVLIVLSQSTETGEPHEKAV